MEKLKNRDKTIQLFPKQHAWVEYGEEDREFGLNNRKATHDFFVYLNYPLH